MVFAIFLYSLITAKKRQAGVRVLAVFMPLLLAGTAWCQTPQGEDPFPLKRIVIPASRLPAELERARQGTLVQMPRKDFEERVKKAYQAAESLKNPPRLVRATYAAELEGAALVRGTGLWRVQNPSGQTAILPMGDLNLALSRLKTATGGEAVLGDVDGKSLGLLIEGSGSHSFNLDWNLQGVATGNGLFFEMKLPAAPVAQLDLQLPADRLVSMSQSQGLVAGPLETDNPQRRLWQLHFSGRTHIDFLIRQDSPSDRSPATLVAQLQTRQQLFPDRVQADYEFQVEVLQQSVRELVFDCDPDLQPYEVLLRGMVWKGWQFQPAATTAKEPEKDKGRGTLTVQLREPFQGTISGLRIRCLAPLALEQQWTSPTIQLRHALLRGETLNWTLHPDVYLEKWEAGAYRLASMGTEKTSALNLVFHASNPTSAAARRPAGFFKTQGVGFHLKQRSWWQLGPQGNILDCDFTWTVNWGSLSQLVLKVPPPTKAWQIEAVNVQPPGAMRSWSATGNLLFIDLARPLTAPMEAKVRVRLRAPLPQTKDGRDQVFDFCDLEPLLPGLREGTLAISVDPLFQAQVTKASLPSVVPEKEGPWKLAPVHFAYRYRNQGVSGKLRLMPQRTRVQVRNSTEVTLTGGKSASLQVRLDLEPVVGTPSTLDLSVSTSTATPWQARLENNRVVSLERLAVLEVTPWLLQLGAANPLEKTALHALVPRSQHWRLKLAQPLTQRDTLTLTTTLEPKESLSLQQYLTRPIIIGGHPLAVAGLALLAQTTLAPPSVNEVQCWPIPLVAILESERQEGELAVHLVGAELVDVKGEGLHEAEPGKTTVDARARREAPASKEMWRQFRLDGQDKWLSPQLNLYSRPLTIDRDVREICDHSELLTVVGTRGRLLHLYRFQVWNWQQREIRVLLPVGTQRVVAAKINGQWVSQVSQQETPAGLQVHLPVVTNSAVQRFEIVYTTDFAEQGWRPWLTLTAPAPQLPVPPQTFRRLWRLPEGLEPLGGNVIPAPNSLNGRGNSPLAADTLPKVWRSGDRLLLGTLLPPAEEGTLTQRQTLLAAEAALRQKMTGEWRLGDALERLAHDHLKDQSPLVLDRDALDSLRLTPRTVFVPAPQTAPSGERNPFWESVGLAHFPCATATLLTSRRQLESWQSQGLFPALTQAVQDAVVHGQDKSGRFRTVVSWLESSNRPDTDDKTLSFAEILDQAPSGFKEWEILAGAHQPDQLMVIRWRPIRLAGLSLAGFLLLITFRLRPYFSPRGNFRLWLVWVSGATLAWWWLPAPMHHLVWPVLGAALVVGLAWYIRRLFPGVIPARPSKSTQKLLKAGLVTPALVWFWLVQPWQGAIWPQGPEMSTVLLVDGPEGKPEQQLALVTPDLLKRLDELSQKSLAPRQGAVLLGAHYHGKITGPVAVFHGDLEVFSFADQALLTLPLAGVDLQENVTLGGKAVYPVPLSTQPGYSLQVPHKGFHRLQIAFSVRLSADNQELRFQVPRLAKNEVELTLPNLVQAPQVHHGFGVQEWTPAKKDQAARLFMHLGRENQVHLRWRTDRREGTGTQAEVREGYYWDLRPPTVSLAAFLQYTVARGQLGQVAVALPGTLDVRSVEVASLGNNAPPRLLGWRVIGQGSKRQVLVELANAGPGQFQLNLLLAPHLSRGSDAWPLPLPLPLQVKATDSFLAYRLDGLEALDKGQNLAVTSMAPGDFLREWRAAGLRDPGLPSAAYGFRRTSATATLILTTVPFKPLVRQEITWTVGPLFADFQAKLTLNGGQESALLLEGDFPPAVTLANVKGAEVQRWARSGTHLQIWLQSLHQETTLELSGWMTHAQKVQLGKEGLFLLPTLRLLGTRLASTQIQITPLPGLTLVPGRLQNLRPEPADPKSLTLSYHATADAVYGGAFRLQPRPMPPEIRQLTILEGGSGELSLVTHLDLRLLQGETQTVTIQCRPWPGTDIVIEGPVGAQIKPLRSQAEEHLWAITLPSSWARQSTLKLKARTSLKDMRPQPVPEVKVLGAIVKENWLAVVGPELQIQTAAGLKPPSEAPKKWPLWPGEAERISRTGSAWRLSPNQEPWLLVPQKGKAIPPVHVLLAEQVAHMADHQHWLHQAEYLLVARPGADIHLTLPAGAKLLTTSLDDQPIMPQQPDSADLWIRLSGAGGPHRLQLRWTFPAKGETVEHPLLLQPVFHGVTDVPVAGSLFIPNGYELVQTLAPAETQLGVVDHFLNRAKAHLDLLAYFTDLGQHEKSEGAKENVSGGVYWFARYWRFADYYLEQAAQQLGDNDPAVMRRQQTLEELRKRLQEWKQKANMDVLAKETTLRKKDLANDVAGFFSPTSDRGLPVYWLAAAGAPAPPLLLTPQAIHDKRAALAATETLLVLVAAIWILSYFPVLQTWVHRFWPEQVMLGTLLGTLVWGWSLLGVGLFVLALACRLNSCGQGMKKYLLRSEEGTAISGSNLGSGT